MPARIVIASRNAHKIEEMHRILDAAGLDVVISGLADFPDLPEVEETGATFAENALLKAHAIAEFTGLPAVADDSGLCVDALNDMPGVLSARWAGQHGDDQANLRLVLAQVSHVPPERRGASFRCAAAVALPDGRAEVVEGRLDGVIIDEPRGANGFGYDPIFVPDGSGRTTAELEPAEKDAISHRGRALASLAPLLADLLQ